MTKITLGNIEEVFKSKLVSVETAEMHGYKLLDELFVDNSGFGREDEPAFTKSKFEIRLREILEVYPTVYTSITRVGQFQVFIGVFLKENKSNAKKLKGNTYEHTNATGDYCIRFHDTDILTFSNDTVTLENGGYYTKTTKDRMNEYLPKRYHIYQKDFEWYIHDSVNSTSTKNQSVAYKNGIVLKL